MAFLPFVHISLKSLIPKLYDFEPKTLGDHIKKKRLKLGLTQKEVACRLSISSWTILNWEKGYSEPAIMFRPIIMQFLGYDPFPKSETLRQRLRAKRREMGWSIKEASEAIGVDPDTWSNWEQGHTILSSKHHALIAQLLEFPVDNLNTKIASS